MFESFFYELNISVLFLLALIYSASIQTVQQFMDSILDEESPEKSSLEAELMPLSGSIKVKDMKFMVPS